MECEDCSKEYWPEVVAEQIEHTVSTQSLPTEPISPCAAQASEVKLSSLLCDTQTKLVYFEFPSFHNQQYMTYDCFHGNGLLIRKKVTK